MSENIRNLIEACLLGNQASWLDFIKRFHRLISGTCSRYVPSSEVDDTVQNVYLKLTENDFKLLRKFRGDSLSALVVYLIEISKNVSYSKNRSIRKRDFREGLPLDLSMDVLDERKNQEDEYMEWETHAEFQALIDSIDETHREILLLRLKGYKFKEIAEILKVPLGTVLARSNRAREKLKKLLP